MQVATTISEMRAVCAALKTRGPLGFVPTMGALHEGHLSLVRAARTRCAGVAVSIFVNPTQFGPNEDFAKYPRSLEKDRAMLDAVGVDALFTPSVEEMYPADATTFVHVEGLSERQEGRSRPGHFRGVATVVHKLFNIVQPDVAFFGQKDAAQLAVIRRMVRDMAIPVEIVACPTIREPDGLAMSSRNAYLSAAERKQALVVYRSLQKIKAAFAAGENRADKLRLIGLRSLEEEPAAVLDYLEIVDPDTLVPVDEIGGPALVAVAAKFGGTRLIDNVLLP
jgi:pantoate--beta-alanine ligase